MDPESCEVVLVWGPGHETVVPTGLRGFIAEAGEFIVPFADKANAFDCIRILQQSIMREEDD